MVSTACASCFVTTAISPYMTFSQESPESASEQRDVTLPAYSAPKIPPNTYTISQSSSHTIISKAIFDCHQTLSVLGCHNKQTNTPEKQSSPQATPFSLSATINPPSAIPLSPTKSQVPIRNGRQTSNYTVTQHFANDQRFGT